MNKKQLGNLGEDMAARYLEEKGFSIVKRNYRTVSGEIDLIATAGDELHFVEVKTRQGDLYGHPAESVTPQKYMHMRRAAGQFLSEIKGMPGSGGIPQFDVIEIQIDHIENI